MKKIDFKLENSENFKLEIEFFSDFAKKVANVPKFRKIIYAELYLSQVSEKFENLFREGGREVSHYHRLRGGCQERGVVVRGTARARLAFL